MAEEVNAKAESLKDMLRRMPYEQLQERIYTCVANGCILLTAYKKRKADKGWSKMWVDDTGQPLLSSKQQESVEEAFQNAPWLAEIVEEKAPQVGGGPLPTLAKNGKVGVEDIQTYLPNPKDLSLDLMMEAFLKKTEEVDTFWSEYKKKDRFGVQKFLNTDRILTIPKIQYQNFPPIGPIDIPYNVKPLVQLLVTFIDSIRFSSGLIGFNSTSLTLLVLIEELVTGQWRQAIFTSLAFLSPSGMAAGVLFKYLINAWMLINPDIRTELFKVHLKGAKSLFIGFLLWLSTILPPNFLLQPVEAVFSSLRKKIEGFEEKVKKLEEEGSKPLAPMKKRLQLSGVNVSTLKKISIQDIQNLQALATWDVLMCSSEFQEILGPIKNEPILRFIVELFNIPTTDDDMYKACGPAPYKGITEKVTESLKGQVVDDSDAPATVVEVPKDVAGALAAFEALPEETQAEILKEKLEEKPVEEKPVEEKPVEEKPVEEKPVEEKPAEEKPVEEKPVEEKPVEEKPAEEKPVEEKPVQKGGRRKKAGTKIQRRKLTPRRATRRL